ncbi:hypothetical protein M8818_004693 [Zalaria obscura]|uniref:Uncharacterized protein n=1 Tax=Zalaria obscura TaxID=2024903 RepID=A0ACC3SCB7_9PEZI
MDCCPELEVGLPSAASVLSGPRCLFAEFVRHLRSTCQSKSRSMLRTCIARGSALSHDVRRPLISTGSKLAANRTVAATHRCISEYHVSSEPTWLSTRPATREPPPSGLRYYSSKHNSRSKKKPGRKERVAQVRCSRAEIQPLADETKHVPAYVDTLIELRVALDNSDVQGVIKCYSALQGDFKLGEEDVAAIAQVVHFALRQRSGKEKKKGPTELLAFVDTLVADIKSKVLPPSPEAHLHLLATFKEAEAFDKGSEFWEWLVKQTDDYVSPSVYGAAIELLAARGRPAEETEDFYIQALKRFPGTFNEYHLSPDAILTDRSQPTITKGIPITLLQGILTARLLRGDTRDAYLALDTAFRLYPTQVPPRFITLFITERPVSEGYKVFMMACRSGVIPGPDGLRTLLSKLRDAVEAGKTTNATALRAMLISAYSYAAAGGTLTPNSLTEVVIACTSVLQERAFVRCTSTDLREITDAVLALLPKIFEIWARHGARPGVAIFNTIITNIAGKGKRKEVFQTALSDMEALGLEQTLVTHRSILTAAGDLQDKEMLQRAWTRLVQFREASGGPVEISDWNILAKAANKADCQEFVQQQIKELAHMVTPGIVSRIAGRLQERVNSPDAEAAKPRIEEMKTLLLSLRRDVEVANDRLLANPIRDFCHEPIPISLGAISAGLPAEAEARMRSVYDEMTTDPATRIPKPADSEPTAEEPEDASDDAANAEDAVKSETEHFLETEVSTTDTLEPASPAIAPTGYPLDELRYQNWKTITQLLSESQMSDSRYRDAVDEAIKKGVKPPKRDLGVTEVGTGSKGLGVGLSDFRDEGEVVEESGAGGDEGAVSLGREEVMRLRRRAV